MTTMPDRYPLTVKQLRAWLDGKSDDEEVEFCYDDWNDYGPLSLDHLRTVQSGNYAKEMLAPHVWMKP